MCAASSETQEKLNVSEVLAVSCPTRFIEWAAKGRELAFCFISQILVCSQEICRDMLLALSWDHLGKPYWQNWGHLYRQRIVGTEVDKFVVQGQGLAAWGQASINKETEGQGRKDTVMVTTFWQMWNYCCLHFTPDFCEYKMLMSQYPPLPGTSAQVYARGKYISSKIDMNAI